VVKVVSVQQEDKLKYFSNYPTDLLPDLKERLLVDNVIHFVKGKKDENGQTEEINIRLWGGTTRSGKSTTKLWGPLLRIGAYGLNWKTQTVEWLGLDIDAKNNGPIQKDGDKELLADALARLGYCEIRNSSSGKGLHIYVDLQNPISGVDSEKGYAAYRNALATRIESDLAANGYTHFPVFDRVGTILYMWKENAKPDAYKLLRAATSKFSGELVAELKAKPVGGPGWPMSPEDGIIRGWSRLQFEFFDYLAKHDPSFSPLPNEGVVCHAHTSVVDQAVRDLGIPGLWATNTPASDPGHHNCYITVSQNIMRVWRAGNGEANETNAWAVVNGRSVAVLNGVMRTKLCVLSGLRATSKTERARAPVDKTVLSQLNVPFSENWTHIEANIQVNTSKVKFIVKGKADPQPGWNVGATQMYYLLDIDDNLHSRKMEESGVSVRTESDVEVQYTRDDSNEMIAYFKNERGDWQHSTNDSLLRAYLQERYRMTSADLKRCLAMKYANDVMLRVEMPCIPFGVFTYENKQYWNVPPSDFAFPKPMDKANTILSRISYIDPSLQSLANQCPGWFALYNHIFAGLQVPKEIRDMYSIETGADYGLLWSAYKIADPLNIVPILVLTGNPETGKTFFADSFRHFFTGRGAYKITNAITSNYPDWLGVVVGSSDDLEEYAPITVTRLKNIGSGDRLEVNPKFKRPSLVGGYLSLIMNMKDLTLFPKSELNDRATHVHVSDIKDSTYDPEFFTAGCRNVTDDRIHARIPNVHWTLAHQAEAFFQYLCSIRLPVPVRRYALPVVGKME
jgi:hypothetical protein